MNHSQKHAIWKLAVAAVHERLRAWDDHELPDDALEQLVEIALEAFAAAGQPSPADDEPAGCPSRSEWEAQR